MCFWIWICLAWFGFRLLFGFVSCFYLCFACVLGVFGGFYVGCVLFEWCLLFMVFTLVVLVQLASVVCCLLFGVLVWVFVLLCCGFVVCGFLFWGLVLIDVCLVWLYRLFVDAFVLVLFIWFGVLVFGGGCFAFWVILVVVWLIIGLLVLFCLLVRCLVFF